MKLVKIDPPGMWCLYEAVHEIIKKLQGKTFIEAGCGAGDLSFALCEQGFKGVGIDFSEPALQQAAQKLEKYIINGQYELKKGDITMEAPLTEKVDLGLSMMVMEHIENDLRFVQKISHHIKRNGHLVIAVPGRRDRWCFEDEVVGHFRRYDRDDLKQVLESAGLKNVQVWSVAVPTANLLFKLSNYFIRRSNERKKKEISLLDQTKLSGIREIPYKTVFPFWYKLILNRVTLYPLFLLQRFFYHTNLGLTMIGFGQVHN